MVYACFFEPLAWWVSRFVVALPFYRSLFGLFLWLMRRGTLSLALRDRWCGNIIVNSSFCRLAGRPRPAICVHDAYTLEIVLLAFVFVWSRGLAVRKDEKRTPNAAKQEERDLCRDECSKGLLDRSCRLGRTKGRESLCERDTREFHWQRSTSLHFCKVSD
jgi:hypothetical protein